MPRAAALHAFEMPIAFLESANPSSWQAPSPSPSSLLGMKCTTEIGTKRTNPGTFSTIAGDFVSRPLRSSPQFAFFISLRGKARHISASARWGIGTTSATEFAETESNRRRRCNHAFLKAYRTRISRHRVWMSTDPINWITTTCWCMPRPNNWKFTSSPWALIAPGLVCRVPDVCIVNVQLQQLSGFDLIEMIRPFPGRDDCLLVSRQVRA